MSAGNYSNAIVNGLLSWIKGLASWVLRLFNLSGGGSPLLWLSRHWLKLLIFFLVLGLTLDLVVWLLRWRPHWVWLRKKRIIVNDERMLAGEKELESGEMQREHDIVFTVASTRQPVDDAPVSRQKVVNTRIPVRLKREADHGPRHPIVRRVGPSEADGDLFEISEGPRTSVYSEDKIFNVKALERRNGRRSESSAGTLKRRPSKRSGMED